jgi:hypothetical protein
MTTKAEEIEAVAEDLDITMTAEFVPWSKSRNAGEKQPSLNWKVTLHKFDSLASHNMRPILTTDYGAGGAHCPSYKQGDRSVDRVDAIKRECETGRGSMLAPSGKHNEPIAPGFADVLHSLVTDAEGAGLPQLRGVGRDAGDEHR